MSIKATVGNRQTILEFPFPPGISDYFRFRPEGYFFMPKYRYSAWDGYIHLMRGSRIPTGLFIAFRKQIERELKLRFRIVDKRVPVRFRSLEGLKLSGIDIWKHQTEAVEAAIPRAKVGGIILNATGSGKTVMAGVLFRLLEGVGVFVVDELTLLYQTKEELEKVVGEQIGIIGDQNFLPARISVATIQTLHRHRRKPELQKLGIDLMVIDEIHLQLAKRTLQTVRALKPKGVFGLTATLQMQKESVKLPVLAIAGPVCYRYPYAQGVEEGKLAPGVIVALDLARVVEEDEDGYPATYRLHIVHSEDRNDLIDALVREGVHRGRRVTVLVERVKHVEMLIERFADLRAAAVYGAVKAKVRYWAKEALDSGDLDVLVCNKVFKKGINIRALDTIIDGCALRSADDAQQKYGRGVRLCSGKDGLIYFDIGDRRPARGGVNYFEQSTRERRKALRDLGVKFCVHAWKKQSAEQLYEEAESLLRNIAAGGGNL